MWQARKVNVNDDNNNHNDALSHNIRMRARAPSVLHWLASQWNEMDDWIECMNETSYMMGTKLRMMTTIESLCIGRELSFIMSSTYLEHMQAILLIRPEGGRGLKKRLERVLTF